MFSVYPPVLRTSSMSFDKREIVSVKLQSSHHPATAIINVIDSTLTAEERRITATLVIIQHHPRPVNELTFTATKNQLIVDVDVICGDVYKYSFPLYTLSLVRNHSEYPHLSMTDIMYGSDTTYHTYTVEKIGQHLRLSRNQSYMTFLDGVLDDYDGNPAVSGWGPDGTLNLRFQHGTPHHANKIASQDYRPEQPHHTYSFQQDPDKVALVN